MSFFDFFFPKRCVYCKAFGSYICSRCFAFIRFTETMVCLICQRSAVDGLTHPSCRSKFTIDGVFPSLVYKGVVKKLVYTFKYPPYLTNMHGLLVDLFYEGIIQKEQFYTHLTPRTLFVPIPLHAKKFRKRGYNQAYLLAQGLAGKFGLDVVDCLQRTRETKTQVGLTKELRQQNIKGAFALKEQWKQKVGEYDRIFLVDDVVTSGATLKEAANILKRAGAKSVWAVTLAHGE